MHGVSLLRQIIADKGNTMIGDAQSSLASCYATGNGVEADTVQAAMWCQRGVDGGRSQLAIQNLPIILKCDFCGTTPARQVCSRCVQVRYCEARCQRGHWNRETDPHKCHCRRRAAEASVDGAAPGRGGASSTSAP